MVEYRCIQSENFCDTWEQRICPIKTIKGIFSIHGLLQACREHDRTLRTVTSVSPLFDEGRWKIQVNVGGSGVSLYLTHVAGDGSKGYKGALYNCEVKLRAGEFFIKPLIIGTHMFEVGTGWGHENSCATNELVNNEDLKKEDKIELDYIIRKCPPEDLGIAGQCFVSPSISSNLLRAYRSLFNDSKTADIQFICRRRARGHVKFIYAHSTILSTLSEYFSTMFSSGFSEGVDKTPTASASFIGTSDLDVDDSDSDWEDYSDQEHPKTSNGHVAISSDENAHSDRKYKVVEIADVPYRTYRALLYYFYTGSISFAPLTSTYNAERAKTAANDSADGFPSKSYYFAKKALPISHGDKHLWTSAKSMYTLCDRLGIPDLKEAAALHIKNSLTPEIVLPEIFSSFSSKHDEIYMAEFDFVKSRQKYVLHVISEGLYRTCYRRVVKILISPRLWWISCRELHLETRRYSLQFPRRLTAGKNVNPGDNICTFGIV